MIPNLGAIFAGGGAVIDLQPTATTLNNNDVSSGSISCTVYHDRDGSIRKRLESAGSQNTTANGSWATPPDVITTAGDNKHVQVTHTGGTNRYSSGSGLGSWIEQNADLSWTFLFAGASGPATDQSTYLVEVSYDGGATTYDSFTYTINLDNLSP